jgi:hypothetical protein
MDGFGEFLGNLFEGVPEVVGEAIFASGGGDRTMPDAGEGGEAAYETYERYLAGGPRDLNINDL